MFRKLVYILILIASSSVNAQNWQTLGNGLNIIPSKFYSDTIANKLYTVGFFTYADDTVLVNNVSQWDGTQWNDLDSGNTECPMCNTVLNIGTYQNNVYVGGHFTSFHYVQNTKHIARYNGVTWESAGNANGSVLNFFNFNSQLLVLGMFDTIGGVEAHGLALYDGVNWSPFDTAAFITNPTASNFANAAAVYNNELYVAGDFDLSNGKKDIAKFDGTNWVSVGGGMMGSGWIEKMLVYKNELYVLGYFFKSAGNAGDGIMKWDGTNWSQLNMGLVFGGGLQLKDMVIYNNDLIVVGFPLLADSIPVQNIAKWDGSKWCNFRNDWRGSAESVAVYNNELIVGCRDTMDGDSVKWVAKWIGGNQTDTCGVVGVEENVIEDGISIYPNPASDVLYIDGDVEIIQVELFDITGKMIMRSSRATKQIDVGYLARGVYLIRVKTSDGAITRKFVKE